MFERFTDKARQAVVLAQDEARRLSHPEVRTEHLLLGLLGVGGESAGTRALTGLGIPLDDLRREIEERIGRGEGAPSGHLPGPATEPVRQTVTAAVPAPRIYLSHRTHPFGTAGYDAVTVLAAVLGNGRGSRLYQRLADGARIAQPDYIGSYGVDLAHAPAPLIITATAKDGVPVERLEEGLSEVVASLVSEPVTEEELSRAKALLTTAWWRSLSTVGGRADTLGRYATQFGDPATIGYRLPQWLAVTADDVTEAAAYALKPESRVTLTYLPEEKA